MNLIVRPLIVWPAGRRTRDRRRGPFKTSWYNLRSDLDYELDQVEAPHGVLSVFCSEGDIRNDGWLRADFRFRDPGVVLSFRHREAGDLQYPCDTYDDPWQNVRAISLTLTALRAIKRYGVAQHAEQYRGWKAIAPVSSNGAEWKEPRTFAEAQRFLEGVIGRPLGPLVDAGDWREAFRMAMRESHPDRASGNHELFIRVGVVRDLVFQWLGSSF
jgi:hypothetical protein